MAIVYGLKVNLSVAMVGMLNHTAIHDAVHNMNDEDNLTVSTGELECAPTGNMTDAKVIHFVFFMRLLYTLKKIWCSLANVPLMIDIVGSIPAWSKCYFIFICIFVSSLDVCIDIDNVSRRQSILNDNPYS